ncbi:MAG: RNA methyltransferase [Anaerolineales bacterium]
MITSTSNARVKWLRALNAQRKIRYREGAFVVEGQRLILEAIQAAWPARLAVHTDHLDPKGRGMMNGLAKLGAEVVEVSEHVMKACADTDSPSGLLAVLELRTLPPPKEVDLALVVDQLSDPGNLGTLLRTAWAAGVQVVYLTPGSVDAFNPKVIRGAMGAHFHLPILTAGLPDLSELLQGLRVRLAEAGGGERYDRLDWTRPSALIIGGEAHGARAAAAELADELVHIPMPGQSESLNAAVAAAILLFEAVRQRGDS